MRAITERTTRNGIDYLVTALPLPSPLPLLRRMTPSPSSIGTRYVDALVLSKFPLTSIWSPTTFFWHECMINSMVLNLMDLYGLTRPIPVSQPKMFINNILGLFFVHINTTFLSSFCLTAERNLIGISSFSSRSQSRRRTHQ